VVVMCKQLIMLLQDAGLQSRHLVRIRFM